MTARKPGPLKIIQYSLRLAIKLLLLTFLHPRRTFVSLPFPRMIFFSAVAEVP